MTTAAPQPAGAGPLVVNVLDLTVDQVAALELESGVAFTAWTSGRAPKAPVLKAVLVQLGGMKPDAAGALPLRELAQRVTLRFVDDDGGTEGD